jgi:hypothetical protein
VTWPTSASSTTEIDERIARAATRLLIDEVVSILEGTDSVEGGDFHARQLRLHASLIVMGKMEGSTAFLSEDAPVDPFLPQPASHIITPPKQTDITAMTAATTSIEHKTITAPITAPKARKAALVSRQGVHRVISR